jgi:hypothetical protein
MIVSLNSINVSCNLSTLPCIISLKLSASARVGFLVDQEITTSATLKTVPITPTTFEAAVRAGRDYENDLSFSAFLKNPESSLGVSVGVVIMLLLESALSLESVSSTPFLISG